MPTPVIMPKYEMAQETGTVIEWLKQEGDHVEKGEPILIVGTDKVEMEVEAPATGMLVGISARPGDVVPIGQPIAHILAPGETWTSPAEERPSSPEVTAPAPQITPVAARLAREHGIDVSTLQGTGPGGRITRADVEAAIAARATVAAEVKPPPVEEDKVKAVPAARRLARELGVDLTTVHGTGPGGRIQSEDVRRAAEALRAPAEGPRVLRTVPLTNIRRTIAERMVRSAREAPQFTVSMDVDMTRSLALLEEIQAAQKPQTRITLTAWLVRVLAWALARHPWMNASFQEDHIVLWEDINVGVAVAVEEGLVVPVIHRAQDLGLAAIAERLEDLVTRARDGNLRLEDVRGGTFTLSNLGMFGVDHFTALVNPPQAGILAVGRVVKRPIVLEDDQVAVRPMATLTVSADHRVVDGAIVARFLADVRAALESPSLLFL